jgi:CheY-like chemotaxis protein
MSEKVAKTVVRIEKKDFYLHTALKGIHANVQSALQKLEKPDLLLVLNPPGSLEHFMIHTDQRYFGEIFHHLLSHVLRSADKGCIEFGYKLLEHDHFCFYVNDLCKPASQQPFKNLDPQQTNLSLLCVKELVKQLGGKTWIESTPDDVLSYWFTVDIRSANPGRESVPDHPRSQLYPDWSEKTILIVEDLFDQFLLLETILKPTKARVLNVENGLKAVNTVKRNDHIDFVLMDLRLPVLDGFEATSRIKAFRPWIPVMAVSAYSIGEEFATCVQAGCDGFIRKPLNSTLLIDKMKRLFKQYDQQK